MVPETQSRSQRPKRRAQPRPGLRYDSDDEEDDEDDEVIATVTVLPDPTPTLPHNEPSLTPLLLLCLCQSDLHADHRMYAISGTSFYPYFLYCTNPYLF